MKKQHYCDDNACWGEKRCSRQCEMCRQYDEPDLHRDLDIPLEK